ncbi:NAD(P)H-binding protein [Paraburkholderia sp. D15]|uniref:NAD-dependent epimerase/dehydratase family protein n=1 Tax=Paraburkholderia sp. D15 TaxID=2880218 RepID=UPI002478CEAE|nr:NAD(P)H-binding protein [Paraburkholderia sp. D15]WGS50162.1 NAD(P)H-binding protein [Paraburkholderia sp. D15]WKF58042.1 hypothetical protein HUO10_002539 [Paraburkholderia busanensis]
MKVLIFGATGMVGQGVLRECLRAPDVEAVQTIGRTRSGQLDPRLTEVIQPDLFDYSALENQLTGFDACFFCLGISSAGMTEADYSHLTHDLTLTAARTLARLNPRMTFIYVSGAGTDSTERGRSMWARVKGRTENALRQLPFAAVYLFRPGAIEPLHGIRSKTRAYRLFYTFAKPILPILRALLPNYVLSTEDIGLAMLEAVRHGAPQAVLETAGIRALSRTAAPPALDLRAG